MIELTMKVLVHRLFFFIGTGWKWNILDAGLVAFSVFDVALTIKLATHAHGGPNLAFLRTLRVLRMVKVMRMVRAVRWIEELQLMLDCILNSVLHLFWCLLLILLLLVMFSLVIVQGVSNHLNTMFHEDPARFYEDKVELEGRFDSVPSTMLSLFQATTGGDDWSSFYNPLALCGYFLKFAFLFYIAFFVIVAWNIVMSTFIEKTINLNAPNIETMVMERRKKDMIYASELTTILEECLDEDHDGIITLQEFQTQMLNPRVSQFFQARDMDMKDAELFFHMLASMHDREGHEKVDIRTFVLGCMRLRGYASNIDLQTLHYDLKTMNRIECERMERLITMLESRWPIALGVVEGDSSQVLLGDDENFATPRSGMDSQTCK
jgi:hypothetical protein